LFFFQKVQCVLLESNHSHLGAVWFEGKTTACKQSQT